MCAGAQLAAKNYLQQDYNELLPQLIEAERCLAAEIEAAYQTTRWIAPPGHKLVEKPDLSAPVLS
jgi:hypothetical protein